ncbi:MAG: hypothetical protein ABIK23_08430 [candidate division WOR-3 bacterium]
MIDPESGRQLVSVVLPIMVLWFITGLFITIFYHLSLFFIEGEFQNPDELLLDLAVTALRIPLFLFAWPVVLFFDRTALHNIKLFWRWLEPKNREQDEELKEVLRQREFWKRIRKAFDADMSLKARRKKEMATGFERQRRLRRLTVNSPELNHIWLLIGKGTSSTGAESLIELYPEAILPEEFNRNVDIEIRCRRPWNCLRCGERIEPERVVFPEPFYLEIFEEGKPVIEGWAYQGKFRMEFPLCQKCGLKQPPVEEDLTTFGRASEVVAALKQGFNFVKEPPEPFFFRIINIKTPTPLRLAVGLLFVTGVIVVVGLFIWAIVFFVSYYRTRLG